MSKIHELSGHVHWLNLVPDHIMHKAMEVATFLNDRTPGDWQYLNLEKRGYAQAKIALLENLLREARSALNDISNLNYLDKRSETTAYHLAINALGKINTGFEDNK